MLTYDALKILPEHLPHVSRMAAAPDSPPEKRLLLARAAVPMEPVEAVTTVAFLCDDPSELVFKAARDTIANMPLGVLSEALRQCQTPEVLDVVARRLPSERSELMEVIVHNRATSDETVAWIGGHQEGHIIDIIAKNQMRVQRSPKIVEALYFNPNARMGLVLNLLEDAVRLGVDISAIPGWEEIVESIHGKEAVLKAKGISSQAAKAAEELAAEEAAKASEAVPLAGEPVEVEETGEELPQIVAEVLAEAGEEAQPAEGDGEGVDDETFQQILKEHAQEPAPTDEEKKDGPLGGSILNDLAKMSVPQKVRLALLGSEAVRRELIRDTRRIVYMSVMKSPRLTEKEVGDFAKNKALNEEIIRFIAMNRDWTSSYAVKMSLICNPKCPAPIAQQFLRVMQAKDVKGLARSHDVPGYVTRAAKQIIAAWEAGKKF